MTSKRTVADVKDERFETEREVVMDWLRLIRDPNVESPLDEILRDKHGGAHDRGDGMSLAGMSDVSAPSYSSNHARAIELQFSTT